jgi:glycosyltransferase involved in cell wall biosynthesis
VLLVAVDAAPLLGDRTGVGVAAAGMIAQLARRPELSVLGFGMTGTGVRRLARSLPAGVRPIFLPMPAGPLTRLWSSVNFPPVELWTGRLDVVHGLNFVVPPSRQAARVVSVWDLTALRYPETSPPAWRRYPAAIQRAVDTGAWVHTGARSVAEEIVEHFGAEPARVRVVPPGIQPAPRVEPFRLPSGRPYILGPGTTGPGQELPGLVAAFGEVAAALSDVDLVLAGPSGWDEDKLVAAIHRSPARDRIHRLRWVEDTAPLLAGSSVFAYPSLYEGFGFLPLEAMAAGVPVVASAAGAVKEMVGDAAILVPPGDFDALAKAVLAVLDDPPVRDDLVKAGRRRAASFTWTAAGDGLFALYRDAVNGRGN